MIQRPQPYIRQIHVCINNRNGESPSCGYSGSEEIVEELRKVCKNATTKERFASLEAAASTFAPLAPT